MSYAFASPCMSLSGTTLRINLNFSSGQTYGSVVMAAYQGTSRVFYQTVNVSSTVAVGQALSYGVPAGCTRASAVLFSGGAPFASCSV